MHAASIEKHKSCRFDTLKTIWHESTNNCNAISVLRDKQHSFFQCCRAIFSDNKRICFAAGRAKTTDATRHKWMAWCVLACGKIVCKMYKKKIPSTNTHDAKYYVVLRGIEISYVHNDFLVRIFFGRSIRVSFSLFFVLFSLALYRSILTFASWVCMHNGGKWDICKETHSNIANICACGAVERAAFMIWLQNTKR